MIRRNQDKVVYPLPVTLFCYPLFSFCSPLWRYTFKISSFSCFFNFLFAFWCTLSFFPLFPFSLFPLQSLYFFSLYQHLSIFPFFPYICFFFIFFFIALSYKFKLLLSFLPSLHTLHSFTISLFPILIHKCGSISALHTSGIIRYDLSNHIWLDIFIWTKTVLIDLLNVFVCTTHTHTHI